LAWRINGTDFAGFYLLGRLVLLRVFLCINVLKSKKEFLKKKKEFWTGKSCVEGKPKKRREA